MSLREALEWRYATKKYTDKKVSEADLQSILEDINLSASSMGLQPYRVIVVSDPALRAELAKAGANPPITEASHLLVFTAFSELSRANIDDFINLVADVRGIPVESLGDFKGMLYDRVDNVPAEENFNWGSKQAYIGLGTGLIAAAALKIDATPMEGFDPAQFDEILGLKEKGLRSVVLLALGYRDAANDPFVEAAKVRLPLDTFVTERR